MSFPLGLSLRGEALQVQNHQRARRLAERRFAFHQNPMRAARATISLRSAFPWLSPNLAAQMGAFGARPDDPDVIELAGVALGRRTRRGWVDGGGRRNANEVRNVTARTTDLDDRRGLPQGERDRRMAQIVGMDLDDFQTLPAHELEAHRRAYLRGTSVDSERQRLMGAIGGTLSVPGQPQITAGEPTLTAEDIGLREGSSRDYADQFMGPMSDEQRQSIISTPVSELERQFPDMAAEFRNNRATFAAARIQQQGGSTPDLTALALTNPSVDTAQVRQLAERLPTYDATFRHIRRGGLTYQGIPLPNADVSVDELRDVYIGDDEIKGILQAKRDQLEDQYDLRGTERGELPDGITPAMRAVYDGIVSALDVIAEEEESVGPDLSVGGVNLNVSDLWNVPYDAAKATVRTATMAMDSLWQGGQARFRQIVNDPMGAFTDPHALLAGSPLGLASTAHDLATGTGVWGETDLGIVLERLANGQDVDVGEGFYVNPDSPVAQVRLSRERRHGLIGGHVITMGRQAADWIPGVEPDDTAFTIVSGAVDLAWILAEPGGAVLDAVARSGQVRRALAHAGGFAETRSIQPEMFDEWLRGTDSQRVIQHYADLDSPEAIARSYETMSQAGGANRMPEWAHYLLADGAPGDVEYVEEMLRGLTGMGYHSPGVAIRGQDALPGLGGVVAPGVAWRRRLASSRLAHDVPETGARALDVYDPSGFVGGLRNSLLNARVDREVIDRLVHRAYTEGFQAPTRVLVQRYERLLSELPDEGTVLWRGEERAVDEVREELADSIEELRPGLFVNTTTPRRNVLYQVWQDAQDAKRTRLLAAGVDESMADDLTTLTDVGRAVDRNFGDDLQREGAYWLSMVADDRADNRRLWPMIEGEHTTDLSSPGFAHMAAEHLSRYLPLEDDYRQLARLTRNMPEQWLNILTTNRGTGQLRSLAAVMDNVFMDRVWKPSRLLRPAWPLRVVGEEQFRIAAAGFDSAISHPMSYVAMVMGYRRDGRLRRLIGDAGDGRFLDPEGTSAWETVAEHTQAMNRAQRTWVLPTGGGSGGRFDPYAYYRGDTGYHEAWTDLLARAHSDDIVRRIAQIELGLDSQYDTIDDLIEAGGSHAATADELRVAEGENWIRSTRADLMDSHPVLGMRGDRTYAARYASGDANEAVTSWDDYIESLQVRLFEMTGRDPDLLHAVARGRFPDGLRLDTPNTTRINRRAARRLKEYEDRAPEVIGGDRAFHDGGLGRVATEGYDRALERMYALLGATPTDRLSRSPAFRQFYVRRMQELLPFMRPDDQRRFLDRASNLMKVPENEWHLRLSAYIGDTDSVTTPTMRSLREAAIRGKGELSLDMADELARNAALDNTRWLLYDVHKRGQFMDAMRIVFPFGEAWKEVATRWLQLTAQRPGTVMQRATQIVGAAGGGVQDWESIVEDPSQVGHIYTNSQGETVFAYPGSEWFTQAFSGVPVKLTGAFNGLTITSSVLPGVGPVLQTGLGLIPAVRESPEFRGIREALFPYGMGDNPLDGWSEAAHYLADQIMSPAWQRFIEGAITTARGKASDDRLLLNSIFDVMRYNVSTGDYNTQSTPEINRLLRDSTRDAGILYMIRGLAGLVLPSAPIPEAQVEGNDGTLLMLSALAQQYHDMQEEDFSTATQRFLELYGENLALVMQDKTVARSAVVPSTEESFDWLADHPGFRDDYEVTYGLWVPGNEEGSEFDYDAYLAGIRDEARKVLGRELKLGDLVGLANNRVASHLYSQQEEELRQNPRAVTESGNLTESAQRYLSTVVRPYLQDLYPGFGDDGLPQGPSRQRLQQILGRPGQTETELRRAIRDERIAAPLRNALRQYVEVSDGLMTQLADEPDRFGGSTTYFESGSTRGMRDYLRDEVIPYLREELPEEFRSRWDVIVERFLERTMLAPWQESVEAAA